MKEKDYSTITETITPDMRKIKKKLPRKYTWNVILKLGLETAREEYAHEPLRN